MRILISLPQVPFVYGGAEKHMETLRLELEKRNHEVDIARIPFQWQPPLKILDSVLANKLQDFREWSGKKIDLLISTKFPTWITDHPNHVTWLLHQHRQAYDLENTQFDDMHNFPEGQYVINKIRELDNKYLSRVKKIFTNSKNVSNRLMKFNGIQGEPLYVPIPNSEKFYNKSFDDYVLFPSRISPIKRQDLLVEAMKYTKTDVKCKIVGFSEDEEWLSEKIKKSGQSNKIELITNASDKELIDYYARSLGIVYTPKDEDYGFVTLEAFLSGKPVITTNDSGGPLEFVEDNKNGFVTEPDPKKLALKIDEIYKNRNETKKMGQTALQSVKNLNLSWDNVINKLLGS